MCKLARGRERDSTSNVIQPTMAYCEVLQKKGIYTPRHFSLAALQDTFN